MPTGTGLRPNRSPVLAQPTGLINASSPGSQQLFQTVSQVASQLGDTAARIGLEEKGRQEQAYLQQQRTQITNRLIDLHDQHSEDPEGFQRAVTAFRQGTLDGMQGLPEHIQQDVGGYIDQYGSGLYRNVVTARRARDERFAAQSFAARSNQILGDVQTLAAAGEAGSDQFNLLFDEYRTLIQTSIDNNQISPDVGALMIAELDQSIVAGDAAFQAERIRKERGLPAARRYLQEQVRDNDGLQISVASRQAIYGEALAKIEGQQTATNATLIRMENQINGLARRYRNGQAVSAEVHEQVSTQLIEAGGWEQLNRLNSARAFGRIASEYERLPEDERLPYLKSVVADLEAGGAFQHPLPGGRLTAPFGEERDVLGVTRTHQGVDFAARRGAAVRATEGGTVTFIGEKGAFGNRIEISHGDEVFTGYAHLERAAEGLQVGDRVEAGDIIGFVGSTGRSTGPHLHYDRKVNGRFVDPLEDIQEAGSDLRLAGEVKQLLAKETRTLWDATQREWVKTLTPPPASELTAIIQAAESADAVDVLQEIDTLSTAFREADELDTSDERRSFVQAKTQKRLEGNLSETEQIVVGIAGEREAALAAAVSKDPIGALIDAGEVDAPIEIDWSDPAARTDGLAERQTAAGLALAKYGPRFGLEEVSVLRPHEARSLRVFWDSADSRQRAELLGTLSTGLSGQHLRATLSTFADEVPGLAVAAVLWQDSPNVATSIVRGQSALDLPGGDKLIPKTDVLRQSFSQQVGSVLAGRPRQRNATFAAVRAVYADLVESQGLGGSKEINQDLFQTAVERVVGTIARDWSGGRFVAPEGMTAERTAFVLENLEDADLEGAQTAKGEPILAEDLKEGARLLESGTRGAYFIDLAGVVLNDEGRAFVLDLSAVVSRRPELLQASPVLDKLLQQTPGAL